MVEIEFDITVQNEGAHPFPLLDDYELEMMLHHTRASIERHVRQALGNLRCEEHDQPPRVRISGVYSMSTEQLDISYHVDACCKHLLLQAIAALNLRGG